MVSQIHCGEPMSPMRTIPLAFVAILSLTIGYHIGILSHPLAINPFPIIPLREPLPVGDNKLHVPPKGISEKRSDLYQKRLCGEPAEDVTDPPPRYLAAFAVGIRQKHLLNETLSRFSRNFTLVLFHYDDLDMAEWEAFEWSQRAIHVAAKEQTKWWFAKRFLHPDVVAPYDYIFIWDDDLRPDGFQADAYVDVARRHALQISQPALGRGSKGITWSLTMRLENENRSSEVHHTAPPEDSCPEGALWPPCASFIEIMAPVFSRDAWRCVWNMIQNDLVHNWGLDFALRLCVDDPAHLRIGVVDSQWVVHAGVPSLGGNAERRSAVRQRCHKEWTIFNSRLNAH